MSTYMRLVNFDEVFKNQKGPKHIVNDLDLSSDEKKDKINNLIFTQYNADVMSTTASCDHGCTIGESYIGLQCDTCGTRVARPLSDELESILWMRRPEGVAKFINPYVYQRLTSFFKVNDGVPINLIQWLTQPGYKPKDDPRSRGEKPKFLRTMSAMVEKRGYNYFVENFQRILETLFNLKEFKKRNRGHLIEMLNSNYDSIFSDYMPLPNRSVLVVENKNNWCFVDDDYFAAIDVAKMMAGIDIKRNVAELQDDGVSVEEIMRVQELTQKQKQVVNMGDGEVAIAPPDVMANTPQRWNVQDADDARNPDEDDDDEYLAFSTLTQRQKENRTAKAIDAYSNFSESYAKKHIAKKTGLARKHLMAARVNFSGRGVITSITKPHVYDEMHVPWSMAVGLLRYHILNKLEKKKIAVGMAGLAFINRYTHEYNEQLNEIFKELIEESRSYDPDTDTWSTGIPVLFLRNPSLTKSSIQKMRITIAKPDTSDPTISFSSLCLHAFNA